MSQSMDAIYKHLVPEQLQSGLRNISVLGGISKIVSNLRVLPSAIRNGID